MRWSVFAIFVIVFAVLDHGFTALISIGERNVAPDLLLILAVFVGLHGSRSAVAWGFVVIGLLTDLTRPVSMGDSLGSVAIIGPATIGYMVAAWATSHLRGLVYRDSLTAMAVLVFALGVLVNLVTVALYSIRGLPFPLEEPLANFHAPQELVHRFFVLIYSVIVAVPLGFLLSRSVRFWNFEPSKTKGGRAAG